MTKPSASSSSPKSVGPDSPKSPARPVRHFTRDDFEFGSLLGIGALAQVVHVRDTYSGDEYALKILDKKQLRRVCTYQSYHLYGLFSSGKSRK
jgi:hypothetical protein